MYLLMGILGAVSLFFAARFYLFRCELGRVTKQIAKLEANARYGQRLHLEENNRALAETILEINRMVNNYEDKLRHNNETEQNIRLTISALSHDLRTPLTSLAGYIQLLKKEPSQEKREEYLNIIAGSVGTLQNLIENFYELSRLELEKDIFSLQSLNLEYTVCECFLRFYENFNQKDIKIEIQDASSSPVVFADLLALERVLHNLIQNLLRYACGTVIISFSNESDYCAVTISNKTDTCLPNDIEQIFNRFYTSDKSRNRSGAGLGLYVSRELVTGMGGKMIAHIEDNRFFITVKLPKSAENKAC